MTEAPAGFRGRSTTPILVGQRVWEMDGSEARTAGGTQREGRGGAELPEAGPGAAPESHGPARVRGGGTCGG